MTLINTSATACISDWISLSNQHTQSPASFYLAFNLLQGLHWPLSPGARGLRDPSPLTHSAGHTLTPGQMDNGPAAFICVLLAMAPHTRRCVHLSALSSQFLHVPLVWITSSFLPFTLNSFLISHSSLSLSPALPVALCTSSHCTVCVAQSV